MRSIQRRFLVVSAVLVAAALALGLHASARGAQKAARATTIHVTAGEFYFRLSAKSARRGTVTFVVKNNGLGLHDFKIAGKVTPGIAGGSTRKLIVNLTKRGRYPYRCTFDAHAQAGMRGVFAIR